MTTLTKPLKRAVKIYGIEGLVNVTISEEGLKFTIPGTKTSVITYWQNIVCTCLTDVTVPAHLFGRPKELLQTAAQKAAKKRAEKGAK